MHAGPRAHGGEVVPVHLGDGGEVEVGHRGQQRRLAPGRSGLAVGCDQVLRLRAAQNPDLGDGPALVLEGERERIGDGQLGAHRPRLRLVRSSARTSVPLMRWMACSRSMWRTSPPSMRWVRMRGEMV